MRDLDRRAPGDRVAIEAQQAVTTERVEHGAQHQAIDIEVLELAVEHSPTRVLAALGEGDEAEEHLAGDLVGLVAEAGQQSFGALHQRARHPAELLVSGVVDAIAAPAVEEFGQRVLQQRQGARSIGHLPDQAATSAGSNVTPRRSADSVIARSSSCGVIGVMISVPSRSSSPRPRCCNGRS